MKSGASNRDRTDFHALATHCNDHYTMEAYWSGWPATLRSSLAWKARAHLLYHTRINLRKFPVKYRSLTTLYPNRTDTAVPGSTNCFLQKQETEWMREAGFEPPISSL